MSAVELGAWPASAVSEEIRVAWLALARGRLQQDVRPGQAHFWQLHAATQQRPHPHVDLDAVGAGHVRLFCPAGIGEGDSVGADRAGAAEIHIQVADVQYPAGTRLHGAFDRPLEPVPVPQCDQQQDRRQQEDPDRQPAPAARAGSAEAPAGGARCGGGGGSIHAAMVAPSSWTGREAPMCAVCTTRARAPVLQHLHGDRDEVADAAADHEQVPDRMRIGDRFAMVEVGAQGV
ncbi:hypothetical protein G6F63_013500 [Rhizopus arrhizus]|nr:hypothetical protein G6F63_013500 [Rhizopus arrhizus]